MKDRNLILKTAIKNKLSRDRHHFAMFRNKVVKKLRKAKARDKSKMIWNQLKKSNRTSQ